jgi:hypothetical protein
LPHDPGACRKPRACRYSSGRQTTGSRPVDLVAGVSFDDDVDAGQQQLANSIRPVTLLSASTIRHPSGAGPFCVFISCRAVGEDGVQLPFDVFEQSSGHFDLVG